MDQTTTSSSNMISLSPLLSLLLLLPIFSLILRHYTHNSSSLSKTITLPPGPKPWPIIGNIFQIGSKPHISLTHFAKVHGSLISLKLGSQIVIIGSSPKVAASILKTHDSLLSARDPPQAFPYKDSPLQSYSIAWANKCSEKWKSLRTLCRTELFSAKLMELQGILREKKVKEMVNVLGGKEGREVNVGKIVFSIIFNTLGNLLFSKDFIDLEDEEEGSKLKGIMWRLMEIATRPNVSDFYPFLAWLDLQGNRKEASKWMKKMFGVWENVVSERRQTIRGLDGKCRRDFLDVFLATGLTDDQIDVLVFELLTAGTETTTTTIEWAMAELLKNKEAMNKLCNELQREVNENPIKESDIIKLPYLQACIKETLRLHPPAPFLLPHRALETCEIMNYRIPKNARILVNVWAIGRDPYIWDHPLSFKPERFIGSDLDFKGHDFELLPFGSGRRICPGLPMATRQVPLVLASLVHCFDWSLPNGEDSTRLDMNEKFGITLQREKPLLVIPKWKSCNFD